MAAPQAFDTKKVIALIEQIGKAELEVDECAEAKKNADRALNSAETRLRNLRAEFTRAVDKQLDPSVMAPNQHTRA